MRQLSKETQKTLYWLMIPFGICLVLFAVDTIWNNCLNFMEWGVPALVGTLNLCIIAAAIACIRQKCWGLLILDICIMIWTWWSLVENIRLMRELVG